MYKSERNVCKKDERDKDVLAKKSARLRWCPC